MSKTKVVPRVRKYRWVNVRKIEPKGRGLLDMREGRAEGVSFTGLSNRSTLISEVTQSPRAYYYSMPGSKMENPNT